jgi:beta-lactamase regulating signal transducer with metallopeptidase domain
MISIYRIPLIQIILFLLLLFVISEMLLYMLGEWGIFQSGWNIIHYCIPETKDFTAVDLACQVSIFGLITFSFVRMVAYTARQFYLHVKWHRFYKGKRSTAWQAFIHQKYPNFRITVFEDAAFVAFTKGLLKPTIFISSYVLEEFGEKEVEAILLHEYHHCKKYDPLLMFISSLLVQGFGYIPFIKKITYYFETWKEIEADRYAVRNMGTFQFLGSVLLRLSRDASRTVSVSGAVGFADKSINYRIEQLIHPDQQVRVPLFDVSLWLRSLLVLAVLMFIFIGGCA